MDDEAVNGAADISDSATSRQQAQRLAAAKKREKKAAKKNAKKAESDGERASQRVDESDSP